MPEFDPALFDALAEAGLDPAATVDVIGRALAEDLSDRGDVTTATIIDPDQQGEAELVTRQSGAVAGLPVAAVVFAIVSSGRLTSELIAHDGDLVSSGDVLMTVRGPVSDLLTAERTALNLLCHLSGVATLTRLWVQEVSGSTAQIRDTRKTMPGLRQLEKYAVRCGGGMNHRMSLSDAALIKDNHVAAAGSVAAAFRLVHEAAPDLPLEVEVDTIEQCAEAIEAGASLILLDNMSLADTKSCVALAAEAGARADGTDRVRLEASGGLSLSNAAAVAATGVDYLSVGGLTHSASALDIGLDLRTLPPATSPAESAEPATPSGRPLGNGHR